MVEAPGTAPGSTTIIPRTVYRHSQQADRIDLGAIRFGFKDFRTRHTGPAEQGRFFPVVQLQGRLSSRRSGVVHSVEQCEFVSESFRERR